MVPAKTSKHDSDEVQNLKNSILGVLDGGDQVVLENSEYEREPRDYNSLREISEERAYITGEEPTYVLDQ